MRHVSNRNKEKMLRKIWENSKSTVCFSSSAHEILDAKSQNAAEFCLLLLPSSPKQSMQPKSHLLKKKIRYQNKILVINLKLFFFFA